MSHVKTLVQEHNGRTTLQNDRLIHSTVQALTTILTNFCYEKTD